MNIKGLAQVTVPCNPLEAGVFPSAVDNITRKEPSMTTIMPQNEMTRKAVTWISEMQGNEPGKSISVLVEEAAVRFNLGPKDVEFLLRFYKDKKD